MCFGSWVCVALIGKPPSVSILIAQTFFRSVKVLSNFHAHTPPPITQNFSNKNLFSLSITFSTFPSLFSTVKCKKFVPSKHFAPARGPSRKKRRKFIRFGPAIAMADKRKKYFSLLASFVEMKWCKTRLAIVASSEINYSEHETLDKVSFYVYGDMKNCFGRTEVRGERFGVSFRLLPLKHLATCKEFFFH